MADDQDWRLRADIADAAGLHGRLREARHFERELEPLIAPDVVLSDDDDTLFAYANTRAAIDEAATRGRAPARAGEPRRPTIAISHWDDEGDATGTRSTRRPTPPSSRASAATTPSRRPQRGRRPRRDAHRRGHLRQAGAQLVRDDRRRRGARARRRAVDRRAPAPAHDADRLHADRPERQDRRGDRRHARSRAAPLTRLEQRDYQAPI